MLANLLAFQALWLVFVGGAGRGHWWPGLLGLMLFLAWQIPRSKWPRADLVLVVVAAVLGALVDTAWVWLGLRYAEPVPHPGLAPIWIVGMWMAFALTLNHSLRFFQHHLAWAALFGLVGGPLAYHVAATQFAAVRFPEPAWPAYLALALAWAVVTPLLLRLASNLVHRWYREPDSLDPGARAP